jgi:hypothetical protein
MIGSQNALALIGIGGLALFGAPACNLSFSFDEEGSGVAETVTYDFESFDEVDVGGVFETSITVVDGPPTVEITVDDNLVDRLDVSVDGGELKIETNGGMDFGVDPTVVITMPELTELDVEGAASVFVTGAKTTSLAVDLSGATDVDIELDVTSLDIDGSGASSITAKGTATELTMDLSGASSADLSGVAIETVSLDLSGSSDAIFGETAEVSGDLSGAATIEVPEETSVSVESSGGASVERR